MGVAGPAARDGDAFPVIEVDNSFIEFDEIESDRLFNFHRRRLARARKLPGPGLGVITRQGSLDKCPYGRNRLLRA